MTRGIRVKIGILGIGSWAIALASSLLDQGEEVIMWGRNEVQLQNLRDEGINHRYPLPCRLIGSIEFTSDIRAMRELDYLINAIPTQHIREVLVKLGPISDTCVLINVSKGIEIESGKFISEVIAEFYPNNSYAVVSGPSHAEEVAKKLPTTLVVSSLDKEAQSRIQSLLSQDNLRVYTNDDIKGIEVSSALKNIIAVAAGICDGLGFGDNTKAAVITRGLEEIKRLGLALGAESKTFSGLAGIGDLIVTATSMHSRNRRCGILIGSGLSTEEAKRRIGMVVEGLSTVKAARDMALKHGVEMPITEALYNILYEDYPASKAVRELMLRGLKAEYN